jgi:hypothetical protein
MITTKPIYIKVYPYTSIRRTIKTVTKTNIMPTHIYSKRSKNGNQDQHINNIIKNQRHTIHLLHSSILFSENPKEIINQTHQLSK